MVSLWFPVTELNYSSVNFILMAECKEGHGFLGSYKQCQIHPNVICTSDYPLQKQYLNLIWNFIL